MFGEFLLGFFVGLGLTFPPSFVNPRFPPGSLTWENNAIIILDPILFHPETCCGTHRTVTTSHHSQLTSFRQPLALSIDATFYNFIKLSVFLDFKVISDNLLTSFQIDKLINNKSINGQLTSFRFHDLIN